MLPPLLCSHGIMSAQRSKREWSAEPSPMNGEGCRGPDNFHYIVKSWPGSRVPPRHQSGNAASLGRSAVPTALQVGDQHRQRRRDPLR